MMSATARREEAVVRRWMPAIRRVGPPEAVHGPPRGPAATVRRPSATARPHPGADTASPRIITQSNSTTRPVPVGVALGGPPEPGEGVRGGLEGDDAVGRCSRSGAVVGRTGLCWHPHRTHSSRHSFRASRPHGVRTGASPPPAAVAARQPPVPIREQVRPSAPSRTVRQPPDGRGEHREPWPRTSQASSARRETAYRSPDLTSGSAPATSGTPVRPPRRETTAVPGPRSVTRTPSRGRNPSIRL